MILDRPSHAPAPYRISRPRRQFSWTVWLSREYKFSSLTLVRLLRHVIPAFDTVCDDLHRRDCRMTQAGVTRDLSADSFALLAHRFAHAF